MTTVLPYGGKIVKIDGAEFDIPATIREHQKADVISLFESYLTNRGSTMTSSPSTLYKILDVVGTRERRAREVVDLYESQASDSLRDVRKMIEKMNEFNIITVITATQPA